ncbi:MAG: GNAT family protein [Candidatus Eisenbacteria bacterium]
MNFPAAFPVLTTARLVLREVADRDVDAVFEMESDPVAMRYWSKPPMRERSEAVASVERAKGFFPARDALRWSLCDATNDRMLGHASLFRFDEQSGRADIGYGLDRRWWGKGLMHEALVAIVAYAFGPLGLRRLEADADPRNVASCRSLERLGFTREGLLRERWVVAGEVSDTAFYGLLAREWDGPETPAR